MKHHLTLATASILMLAACNTAPPASPPLQDSSPRRVSAASPTAAPAALKTFRETLIPDGTLKTFTLPHTEGDRHVAGNQVAMDVAIRVEITPERGGHAVYIVGNGTYRETGADSTTYAGGFREQIAFYDKSVRDLQLHPEMPAGSLQWTEIPTAGEGRKEFSPPRPGVPHSNLVGRFTVYHNTGRLDVHLKTIEIEGKR